MEGPYSFVYYNSVQRRLWFARDPLGRHSLLWSVTDDLIYVTSVAHKHADFLAEVPAAGVFSVHFDDAKVKGKRLHQFRRILLSRLRNIYKKYFGFGQTFVYIRGLTVICKSYRNVYASVTKRLVTSIFHTTEVNQLSFFYQSKRWRTCYPCRRSQSA